MPIHTVVVPTDGSTISRQIVPEIGRLLDPNTTRIILVRVTEPVDGLLAPPPHPVVMAWTKPLFEDRGSARRASHPIYDMQVEASERAKIESQLTDIRHELKMLGFDVEVDVRFGDPAEEIVDSARAHQADVIAIATHGRSGLSHLVMGSVSEQVVRKAPVPVMVFRPTMAPTK